MNIRIFPLLVALAGQILIASVFFYFIPSEMMAANERALDFVVVSIAFWLWAVYFDATPINFKDKSQKQIGSLGVRLVTVGWYSTLAILFVIYNIIEKFVEDFPPVSFKIQLLVQCILLFFLLLAFLFTGEARRQTELVYNEEQALKAGKSNIKSVLNDTVIAAEESPGIPDEIKYRLKVIAEETRYISPSISPESVEIDKKIIKDCTYLRGAFTDYKLNKRDVESLIYSLGRNMSRRRKAL